MNSLIIYDKKNLDSAFSASLLKYYYEEVLQNDEINLSIVSIDDVFGILEKDDRELKSNYSDITFINCLLSIQVLDRLYNLFINNTTFILCNKALIKKIKNRYISTDKFISGNSFSHEDNESCTLYLYKTLKGNISIPTEIKYISSFEMNNYPDEGYTRDEVMKYTYGLTKTTNNEVDTLYDYVKSLLLQSPSISTEELSSIGETYVSTIDDYILFNFRTYGSPVYKIGKQRKAVLLQTPYKLSANIVGNELFKNYDNIITVYLTGENRYLLGLYTLPRFSEVEEDSDITSEQEQDTFNSLFDSNEYLNDKFGSQGNELFGFTEISQEDMFNILSKRSL